MVEPGLGRSQIEHEMLLGSSQYLCVLRCFGANTEWGSNGFSGKADYHRSPVRRRWGWRPIRPHGCTALRKGVGSGGNCGEP